jgi:hypothetical protein
MIDASTATNSDEQPEAQPAGSEPTTDIHERRKADHIRIIWKKTSPSST